jgi:hypothetical protein
MYLGFTLEVSHKQKPINQVRVVQIPETFGVKKIFNEHFKTMSLAFQKKQNKDNERKVSN